MGETLFYTLPQWFIFSAIFVVVYGWAENKKAFRAIGAALFVLLGFFALYALSGDFFAARGFLTPSEIVSEELAENRVEEIPLQVQLFPAYLSFVLSAILAVPAILLDWKNKKSYRYFIVLAALTSLFGFFVVVGALRTL